MKRFLRNLMFVTLIVAMVGSSTSVKALISDDFETYVVGAFPSPKWSDVGAVLPAPPIPSIPSALIIRTTDAFGNTTKALSTVGVGDNGLFDSFAFFGGELSPDNTIGNIGVVDNVNITITPIPETTTMLLLGSG